MFNNGLIDGIHSCYKLFFEVLIIEGQHSKRSTVISISEFNFSSILRLFGLWSNLVVVKSSISFHFN